MITEMVEAVQKKAVGELAKRQQAIKAEVEEETGLRLSEAIGTLKQHTEAQLEDKVRVDEVQDALKKITDGFHAKLNFLQENMQVYVTGSQAEASQGIVQLKENVAKMLTQLSTLIEEKETLELKVAAKVDETNFSQKLALFSEKVDKCMEGLQDRVSKEEVGEFIDKKANLDEICSDIQNITSNVSKLVKEFKFHKSDCLSFNEA